MTSIQYGIYVYSAVSCWNFVILLLFTVNCSLSLLNSTHQINIYSKVGMFTVIEKLITL